MESITRDGSTVNRSVCLCIAIICGAGFLPYKYYQDRADKRDMTSDAGADATAFEFCVRALRELSVFLLAACWKEHIVGNSPRYAGTDSLYIPTFVGTV